MCCKVSFDESGFLLLPSSGALETQKRLKIFSGSGSINGDRENVMLQALSPDVLAATEEK